MKYKHREKNEWEDTEDQHKVCQFWISSEIC